MMSITGLLKPLESFVEKIIQEFDQISSARKNTLEKLAAFSESKIKAGETAQFIFICTHNSRRSHMAQIWAQAAAFYYQIPHVVCFSGGTEATAFNPRAVVALQNAGFQIVEMTAGENPVYEIKYADQANSIIAFSKEFSHQANPAENFCAVMTCSEADQNCPFVPGATQRISLPYDDPKDFDGKPQETEKYQERAHQIGREIFYAFSKVTL